MSYALKIPNVNFANVSVGRVTYVEPIPCTGVMLSDTAPTFIQEGESVQLTAILTPTDTTDTLVWSSSNDNIATVDKTGTITIHGIGTATITATCGAVSATATITQTRLKAKYPLSSLASYEQYIEQLSTANGTIVKVTSGSGSIGIGQDYHNDNAVRIRANTPHIECIKVPYGATKVKMATTDNVAISVAFVYIVNSESMISYEDKQFPEYIRRAENVNTLTGLDVSFGQAIALRPTNAQAATLDYVYFE